MRAYSQEDWFAIASPAVQTTPTRKAQPPIRSEKIQSRGERTEIWKGGDSFRLPVHLSWGRGTFDAECKTTSRGEARRGAHPIDNSQGMSASFTLAPASPRG